MSKTLRLNAVAMAQERVSAHAAQTQSFDATSPEFSDLKNRFVAVQFEKMPESMIQMKPVQIVISFYAKGNGSGMTTGESDYVETSGGTAQQARDSAEIYAIRAAMVSIGSSTEKNDIINGVACFKNGDVKPIRDEISNSKTYQTEREYILQSLSVWKATCTYTYTGTNQRIVYTLTDANGLAVDYATNGILLLERAPNNKIPEDNKKIICNLSQSTPAYIELTYDEGNPTCTLIGPNGYVDENEQTTFLWALSYPYFPIGDITQNSAVLKWKNGTAGEEHSINISGNAKEYVMPAGTLPESSELYWQVVASTNEGTLTSAWQKISTVDSTATATATTPNGSFVDGTKTARFAWSHSTEYGTAQTAYDLQINHGSAWTTVQSEQTANQYADIVPGTLAAGQTQWRVRTYNEDNVPGEWSNVLSCIVISSPAAPQVTVTNSAPRPTITWNAVGQQAYQVVAGSYDSGLIYGTEKTLTLPVFLPDGQTNLSVRVMNEYGYWSPYGTAMATITNVPGNTITLTAEGGRNAFLTWNGIENAAEYWIYRNGKRIAKTTDTTHTDHYSIGSCTYRVRAAMADGLNYTDSNTKTVSVSVDHPVIKTLDGDWLDLPYTATQMQQTSSSLSRDVYLMHYNGAAYPVPEVGEFQNRTMSLSVAFADMEIGKILESMIGRIVCMKNQYGDLIIGIFSQIARAKNEFFTTYSATIEEVDAGEIG